MKIHVYYKVNMASLFDFTFHPYILLGVDIVGYLYKLTINICFNK